MPPPARLRPSPKPPGGKPSATRSCQTSFAARAARTATSRSPPNACARREPARRSAVRGWCRASGVSAGAVDRQHRIRRRDQAGRSRRPEDGECGGLEVSWEVDLAGRLRAGSGRSRRRHAGGRGRRARRSPARDDRCRDQLLHAGRRAAPARHRARDLRGAGRNAASRAPRASAPVSRRRSTSSARRPTRRARTRRSRRSRRLPPCRGTASRC